MPRAALFASGKGSNFFLFDVPVLMRFDESWPLGLTVLDLELAVVVAAGARVLSKDGLALLFGRVSLLLAIGFVTSLARFPPAKMKLIKHKPIF